MQTGRLNVHGETEGKSPATIPGDKARRARMIVRSSGSRFGWSALRQTTLCGLPGAAKRATIPARHCVQLPTRPAAISSALTPDQFEVCGALGPLDCARPAKNPANHIRAKVFF